MKLLRVVSVISVLFSMTMAVIPHRRYFGFHKDPTLDEINERILFQYESTKGPDASKSNVGTGSSIEAKFADNFADQTTEPMSTTTTVANLYTSTLADTTIMPVGELKHNKQTNIDETNPNSEESIDNYTNPSPKDIEEEPKIIQETLKNQTNIDSSLKGENVKNETYDSAKDISGNNTKPILNSRFGYNTDYILTPVATIQNTNPNVPANNFIVNSNSIGTNYNQNLPNPVLLNNLGQGNADAITFPSDTPTQITNTNIPGNNNSGFMNNLPSVQTNQVSNINPGYSTATVNLQTIPISLGSNQIQAVPVMGILQNTGNNNQGYGYNQFTVPNSNGQVGNNGISYANNNNFVATNYPQNQNFQQFAVPAVNNEQNNIVSNGQLFQLVNVPNNNINAPNAQSNNYYVPNTQNQFVNSQPLNTMQPGLNSNIITFNNQNYQLVPVQDIGGNVQNNQNPISNNYNTMTMADPQNGSYGGAGAGQIFPNNGPILNNNNQMHLVNNG